MPILRKKKSGIDNLTKARSLRHGTSLMLEVDSNEGSNPPLEVDSNEGSNPPLEVDSNVDCNPTKKRRLEGFDSVVYGDYSNGYTQNKNSYKGGMRLVDCQFYLTQLSQIKHKDECFSANFIIQQEVIKGFYSDQTVFCTGCNVIGKIKTSDCSINEKIVLSTMAAGIQNQQLRKILNPLEIPTLNTTSFSKLQKTVGDKALKVAVASCRYWAEVEKDLALKMGAAIVNGSVVTRGELDGCYGKRTFGNNYNAKSGGAAIVGSICKRLLDFIVLQNFCLTCTLARRRNNDPKPHNCPINYRGTASQMEPEMVVRMFQRSEKFNGIIFESFVGDGDSAVLSALLRSMVYIEHQISIRKIDCKNHLLRNYTSHTRELLKRGRMGDTTFLKKELRRLPNLEKSLSRIIGEKHAAGSSSKDLKDALLAKVHCHFGRHQQSEGICSICGTQVSPNAQIIEPALFESILSLTRTNLLCHADSLIENEQTNQIESFNNIQAAMTGGKRFNLSLSWLWTIKYALSVISWNSPNQDPTEVYKSVIFNEPPGYFHQKMINDFKLKRHGNAKENTRLNDVVPGIKKFLTKKLEPISFTAKYSHPMVSASERQNIMHKKYGAGYSSSGIVTRPDLPDTELLAEKDMILTYLLKNARDAEKIKIRTANKYENAEWQAIRGRTITSDTIPMILKSKGTTFEKRVESWPNKVKQVLYNTGFRFTASFLDGVDKTNEGMQYLAGHLEVNIQTVGILIHPEKPFLVGNVGGLFVAANNETVAAEVIYLGKHKTISEAVEKSKNCPILKTAEGFSMKNNSDDFIRIQANMAIGRITRTVVLVMTDFEKISFQIDFIKSIWDNQLDILEKFFYYLLYEMADSNKSRDLPPRSYASIKSKIESEEWQRWPHFG